jgi:hypothetical protein
VPAPGPEAPCRTPGGPPCGMGSTPAVMTDSEHARGRPRVALRLKSASAGRLVSPLWRTCTGPRVAWAPGSDSERPRVRNRRDGLVFRVSGKSQKKRSGPSHGPDQSPGQAAVPKSAPGPVLVQRPRWTLDSEIHRTAEFHQYFHRTEEPYLELPAPAPLRRT